MMTINDLMSLNTIGGYQEVEIWEVDKEATIFSGKYQDMPYELEYKEILGFEVYSEIHNYDDEYTIICFNIKEN